MCKFSLSLSPAPPTVSHPWGPMRRAANHECIVYDTRYAIDMWSPVISSEGFLVNKYLASRICKRYVRYYGTNDIKVDSQTDSDLIILFFFFFSK